MVLLTALMLFSLPPPSTPAANPPRSVNLSFNLLPEPAPALDPASQLRIERQIILGQLDYLDLFAAGGYTCKYCVPHEILASTSLALFAANAILGLAAPVPNPKPLAWDRVMAHRLLMFTAFAGMITEAVLGIYASGQAGKLDERDFARDHLVLGYCTYAATIAGALVYVF